jgi:acyl-[acyl-carrier-protein]-phospholipid O-acyltransferase / long-chain-fatty-acid--[acyl-carrier-protein] ligase
LAAVTVAAVSGEDMYPFNLHHAQKPVFQALVDARARYGGSRPAVVDGDETVATYDTLVMASLALGNALRKGTSVGESVGVMLPTSLGTVIAFFALSAFGRVPTMLNFSNGAAGVVSALRTAKVKRIVTAHKFVEAAKLHDMVGELSQKAEIVYLEDVKEHLSVFDKAVAALGKFAPNFVTQGPASSFVANFAASLAGKQPVYDRPAVILFTSGTEGEPKGVALSHFNILVNIEQARNHIALYPVDIMFNPLPMFHCFGLNAGVLLPIMLGFKTVLHPTPLQPKEIARRIREADATILITTDTFISQYARAGNEGDLKNLRLAVCGAERVRDETRQLLRRKSAIEILEGYGVTEAAPIAAINQPGANHPGTIGHILPGMQVRLEPVEGIPNAGRMFVKGPNIMLGYIRPDRPGVIQPPKDGWHDTGDVVHIDEDGFISIKGRLKRFAKIGGEAVSLAVVENCASALWPDFSHAAISLPDGRKGEHIVLLTTNPDAERVDLVGWAQNHGVPEIAVPKRIIYVEAIPVLGTGKTDYVKVEKMARAEKPAALS